MVTISQIEAGAVKFLDGEVAPKIPVNVPNGQLKKIAFLAGAAYAVHKNVQRYANHPMLAQLGAVDEEGNIDLEGLLEAAQRAVPEKGFKATVPILGDLNFTPRTWSAWRLISRRDSPSKVARKFPPELPPEHSEA